MLFLFPTDQYAFGVLRRALYITDVSVPTWRDNLCATDTLSLTLASILDEHTLTNSGVVGRVCVSLQNALLQRSVLGIGAAQQELQDLLPEIVHGYKAGDLVALGDVWEAVAGTQGSRLALNGHALGQCSCKPPAHRISLTQLSGWTSTNTIALCSRSALAAEYACGDIVLVDVAKSVSALLRQRYRASRQRLVMCPSCGHSCLFALALIPGRVLCVGVCEEGSAANGLKVVPMLTHLTFAGLSFALKAVIVRAGAHYVSYYHAHGLRWLTRDGWYFYDGIGAIKLRYVGAMLRVETVHSRQIEMLLYVRAN